MIKELKENEQIFIEELDNNLCNNISILQYQLDSYDKLFAAYMNNTSEIANELNLKKFLDIYSNTCAEMANIKIQLLKDNLKDEYQYFLANNFIYFLDYLNKTLKVIKNIIKI